MIENGERDALLKIVNESNKWFTGPFYVNSKINFVGACCCVGASIECDQLEIRDFKEEIELNDESENSVYQVRNASALEGFYQTMRRRGHCIYLKGAALANKDTLPTFYQLTHDVDNNQLIEVNTDATSSDNRYIYLIEHKPKERPRYVRGSVISEKIVQFNRGDTLHVKYMTEMFFSELDSLYQKVKTQKDPVLLLKY